SRSKYGPLVPLYELAHPVTHLGWSRQHRLPIQEPLDVFSEAVGSLVTAIPFLGERFHDDPVEVTPQEAAELHGLHLAIGGNTRSGFRRSQALARCRGLALADDP